MFDGLIGGYLQLHDLNSGCLFVSGVSDHQPYSNWWFSTKPCFFIWIKTDSYRAKASKTVCLTDALLWAQNVFTCVSEYWAVNGSVSYFEKFSIKIIKSKGFSPDSPDSGWVASLYNKRLNDRVDCHASFSLHCFKNNDFHTENLWGNWLM